LLPKPQNPVIIINEILPVTCALCKPSLWLFDNANDERKAVL